MAEFALYNYFRSSASHRVRIALEIKGVKFEYRPVHLLNNGGEQNCDEYRRLNPSAQVPTLIHSGHAVGQSLAILDYLDRVVPNPRLFPETPLQRALVWQACEIVNSGTQPMVNIPVLKHLRAMFDASEEQRNQWSIDMITTGLKALEAFLAPHAGRYSFGETLTASDCCLIPQLTSADRFKVNLDAFPTLQRIRRECEKLETFQRAHPRAQPDTPEDLKATL